MDVMRAEKLHCNRVEVRISWGGGGRQESGQGGRSGRGGVEGKGRGRREEGTCDRGTISVSYMDVMRAEKLHRNRVEVRISWEGGGRKGGEGRGRQGGTEEGGGRNMRPRDDQYLLHGRHASWETTTQ